MQPGRALHKDSMTTVTVVGQEGEPVEKKGAGLEQGLLASPNSCPSGVKNVGRCG